MDPVTAARRGLFYISIIKRRTHAGIAIIIRVGIRQPAIRATLFLRPDLDVGIPVALDILLFIEVIPVARFQLKDKPGINLLLIFYPLSDGEIDDKLLPVTNNINMIITRISIYTNFPSPCNITSAIRSSIFKTSSGAFRG
jgi:hypothetical protein